MEEIKCYWETANIAHFCKLFRNYCKFPSFSIEELEEALVSFKSKSSRDQPFSETDYLLIRIICILLQGYFSSHTINEYNWEDYLHKIIDIHWLEDYKHQSPFACDENDENDREARIHFYQLTVRSKVEILHCLCEYRLLANDSSLIVSKVDPDLLRLESIGRDNQGYIYWYFEGNRLYREKPSVSKIVNLKLKNLSKSHSNKFFLDGDLSSSAKKAKFDLRKIDGKKTCSNNLEKNKNSSSAGPLTSCGIPLTILKEAWCVIASNPEEWRSLTDRFNTSKYDCENKLGKVLTSLLPEINKIETRKLKVEQKEAKRRYFELLPRRVSSRLEIKKITKEMEEKKAQEEVEKQSRINASSNERMLNAQKRALMIDREERRLRRAQEKEKNLEADEKQVYNMMKGSLIKLKISQNETKMKALGTNSELLNKCDNFKTDLVVDLTNSSLKEAFFTGLSKIISTVYSNLESWPFKEPVDEDMVPDYYQVIEEPIDLSVIKRRIEDHRYTRLSQVERDFQLLVNNCEKYNGPRNGYTQMAYTIWRVFKRSAKRFLKYDLILDESEAFLYPRKRLKVNPEIDEGNNSQRFESSENQVSIFLNKDSSSNNAKLNEPQQLYPKNSFISFSSNVNPSSSNIFISSNQSSSNSQNLPSDNIKKIVIKNPNFSQSTINGAAVSASSILTNGVHNVNQQPQKVLKFKIISPNNLKLNAAPIVASNVQLKPQNEKDSCKLNKTVDNSINTNNMDTNLNQPIPVLNNLVHHSNILNSAQSGASVNINSIERSLTSNSTKTTLDGAFSVQKELNLNQLPFQLNPIPGYKFEIASLHSTNNSNIKVLRLRKISEEG